MRTFIGATVVLGCLLLWPAPSGAQSGERAVPPSTASALAPINLNAATRDQLETLPGVGPRTAALILEYRQKSGGFKKVEELMNIKGIGEKSFLKLKALVTVVPRTDKASGGQ